MLIGNCCKIRVLLMVGGCFLGFTLGRADAAVTWQGDDLTNPTSFEVEENWDTPTYDPVPSAGNEDMPPGDDSIFMIGEGNHTVILTEERSGINGTEKLGTFSIGSGTYPEGTEDEETGPGDEISTFIIRNSVTFTGKERASGGEVATALRPIRIGRADRQPKIRGDGQVDFPWGIVLLQDGHFQYDPALSVSSTAELRIGMSDNEAGGSIFEIGGTASLNIIGKVRVGDRNTTTSAAASIFRVRGSEIADNAIVMDDLKVASLSGMWDSDRPAEYENRIRYNRGKSVLEFVLDAGGVTPMTINDALEIGDNEPIPSGHPESGTLTYTHGFLRVKLSQPLDPNSTPGFVGQAPLVLINSDRIITTVPAVPDPNDPLQAEFTAGRFFDPDRDGPSIFADADPDPDLSPHRFLPSGGQVISDYANATYTWTIEYFEDSNGADNGVIGSYVRLVDGVLSGTPGDFDGVGGVTSADRDLLTAAIANPPSTRHELLGETQHMFDLNADDVIDSLDLTAFNTYFLMPDGLAGDFNGDMKVDAADYTVWRDNLGGNSSVLNGNGSGAATVVAADYDLWKSNFGEMAPGGGGLAGAAVPEPMAALLAAMGLFGLIGMRRRAA